MPASNKQNTKKVVLSKAGGKTPGKPNASILNFFKKVDSPLVDESIFLSQGSANVPTQPKSPTPDLGSEAEDFHGDFDGDDRSIQ